MLRVEGVVLGDYGVGKTSILYALLNKQVPEEHVPTILEAYRVEVNVKDDTKMELVLHDTPGNKDHAQFTHMSMNNNKEFVLLCFSLIQPKSFENIRKYWINEVRTRLPNVPIFLLGTQLDLRNKPQVIEDLIDQGTPAIDTEQGKKLAEDIGALHYVECSALDTSDIDNIRQKMTQIAYEQKQKYKKEKCVIS